MCKIYVDVNMQNSGSRVVLVLKLVPLIRPAVSGQADAQPPVAYRAAPAM
jgi:hypothetical protein